MTTCLHLLQITCVNRICLLSSVSVPQSRAACGVNLGRNSTVMDQFNWRLDQVCQAKASISMDALGCRFERIGEQHGQKINPSKFPDQRHQNRAANQRGQPQRPASTIQASCPWPGAASTVPAGISDFLTIRHEFVTIMTFLQPLNFWRVNCFIS